MTDEYIRKEDVLKEKRTGTFPNGICMEAKACVTVEYIKSIPPADVVSVVRCKDCKNWQYGRVGMGCYWDADYPHQENDFCSRGVKMDGEEEET